MKKYALLSITMFLAPSNLNAEKLYQSNNDKFWEEFSASQKVFVSCASPENTSEFIMNSFQYSGNAEVTQAYAEEIEKVTIKNPACIIRGISLLNEKQLKDYYTLFIKQALFYKPEELIVSIKNSGILEKYPNVQKLFK